MDLKADDALNVDIDPAILLSYELDKLNLDNIPNDIFDEIKLTDESLKSDDKIDVKNNFLLKDIKITESALPNCPEIKNKKISTIEDKSCDAEIKAEIPSECSEIKKDINGNDESVSEENLNDLFVQFKLSDSDSDSDNEEVGDTDTNNLKARGPLRACKSRRASRKNDTNNLWCKPDSFDRSQFNSERLRFLSGSSQIQFSENAIPDQYALNYNNQATIDEGVGPYHFLSSDGSCYCNFEDARAVSSPESGYDSSSTHSIAGSPPPPVLFTSLLNLDLIPETVDDQNIIDFLTEYDDSALINNNLSACNINDEDEKGEITKILNFLKDTPAELHESSNAATNTQNLLDVVPFTSHSIVSTISEVNSPPAPSNTTSKQAEPKKKLVPKLQDKAKGALRAILLSDEYFDAKKRIYAKIREDQENHRKPSVIYVEDEMDKDSKNRTNLHNAVLNGKIEDIFSLVEIHKQYHLSFADINIRDRHGKTALDYAIQKQMTLVADYLKENTACQSVNLDK